MKIYFSPDCPRLQDYSIVAMMHYLGYAVAKSDAEPFDVACLWSDATRIVPPASLLDISRHKTVLNIRCTDISKVKVDQIWRQACGYSSLVVPTVHQGKVVKKPDDNGQGGGVVIDCPIAPSDVEERHVYQRYITSCDSGAQLEYRVPVVMGCLPLVFEVYKDDPEQVEGRRIENQFKRSIVPRNTGDIFSDGECGQILEFCRLLGLDIGELDVLRCASTGRIYVIDANTTPTYFNMFNRYWRTEDKRYAIRTVAECWEAQLLDRLRRQTPSYP